MKLAIVQEYLSNVIIAIGIFRTPNTGGSEIYMVKAKATTCKERLNMVRECIANGKDYGKTVAKRVSEGNSA